MDELFLYLTANSGFLAYAVIFGILVACGLGFPLPEDIPLTATGYLIWHNNQSHPIYDASGFHAERLLHFAGPLLLVMLGVLIGDALLFTFGKKAGMALIERKKVKFLTDQNVGKAQRLFATYGDKLVFFARFIAGFRAVVFLLAGAMGMKYWRFLLFDGLAALLSVPLWLALGYGLGHFFGAEMERILEGMKQLKTAFSIAVAIGLGIAIIFYGIKWLRSRRKAQVNG